MYWSCEWALLHSGISKEFSTHVILVIEYFMGWWVGTSSTRISSAICKWLN